MRRLGAWLCVAGGLLWALKAAYDWLILERVVHRGYPASDFTDYAEFAIPLLCIGGVAAIRSCIGKKIDLTSTILSVGLLLQTGYHVYETYLPALHFPAGFFFMFPGIILLWIGALSLYKSARQKHLPTRLRRWAAALFATNIFYSLLPFLSGVLADRFETPVTATAVMLVGVSWAGIGLALVGRVRAQETDGASIALRS